MQFIVTRTQAGGAGDSVTLDPAKRDSDDDRDLLGSQAWLGVQPALQVGYGQWPRPVTVAGVTVPAAEQGPPAWASESESPATVTCQG